MPRRWISWLRENARQVCKMSTANCSEVSFTVSLRVASDLLSQSFEPERIRLGSVARVNRVVMLCFKLAKVE